MNGQDKIFQILLAEDNPIDILVTKEAMESWQVKFQLHVVEDGQEAVDFLLRRGIYDKVERPDVVLLDLNLPKKNGVEVLTHMRQDPDLSHVKVVVITTSGSESDLEMCRKLGVKIIITKPLDFEEYLGPYVKRGQVCF